MMWMLEPVNWLILAGALALVELIVALEVTYLGVSIGAAITAGVLVVVDTKKFAYPELSLLIWAGGSILAIVVLRYFLAKPAPVQRFTHDVNEEPYKGDNTHWSRDDQK